ncbi:DUF2252 family protein [Geodermatophilus sp. URMC 65]
MTLTLPGRHDRIRGGSPPFRKRLELHRWTAEAVWVSGYLGRSDKVDRALCAFARAYADQTEQDHQRLVDAVARGAVPCEPGV